MIESIPIPTLADKIQSLTHNLEMTSLIISIFMDTIYEDVCSSIWNPHCAQQQLDEYNTGISRREKKQKNTSARTLPRHAPRVVTNDLFSKQIGLSNSIASGVIGWVL